MALTSSAPGAPVAATSSPTRKPRDTMATDRRELRGIRLTEDAHAGLDALADRTRCTKNALLEALGQTELEARRAGEPRDHPVDWAAIVERAGRIDRQRHSRR